MNAFNVAQSQSELMHLSVHCLGNHNNQEHQRKHQLMITIYTSIHTRYCAFLNPLDRDQYPTCRSVPRHRYTVGRALGCIEPMHV